MEERRKLKRFSVEPISAKVLHDGRMIDLSVAGAFIECPEPLTLGTTFQLRFSLRAEGPPLHMACRVHWAGEYGGGKNGHCSGMGVSFVGVAPEQRIELARHLKALHQEKESVERVAVGIPARGHWGDISLKGMLVEASPEALVLQFDRPVPIDEEVIVRFLGVVDSHDTDKIDRIEVRGTVRRLLVTGALGPLSDALEDGSRAPQLLLRIDPTVGIARKAFDRLLQTKSA
ncbi:MAG: PilZ domain-containing protein [Planctomycetota bacterium]